ncbi:thermonuclease family protein [Actinomycetospora termitidis]|uniref:Thermonuclease family protein n=1 Tax=Actinomycetospora termitidis TaxID=3053470 RepID=A0ABT7MFI4_9PSEU|nr:thermonuclease family protein [Actinomycetospora sp. Odt1-22]MDL5159206.1 thermonuclease family protein [Actinomycetospora sp. Odt1-22]
MTTGTAPRVLLAMACLVGLLGAVAVLSGAVPVGPAGAAPPVAVGPAVSPAAAPDSLATAPTGEPATVLAVADPVTVDVRLEGGRTLRVRALGVQPPERCYADEALQFARTTLAGRAVMLVGDGRADRFSRALAWVSMPQGDYAVVAAEAGVVTTYAADAPRERMPAVRAAAARAEKAGRGLWGPPCTSGP